MTPEQDFNQRRMQDNLITWLETEALKAGTQNQRERWAATLLPEEELLKLAREELFRGFESFARWHTNEVRREMRTALRHSSSHHSASACAMVPEFEVADIGELSAASWDALKKIITLVDTLNQHEWLERAKEKATWVGFTHWATCPACEAEICRTGVKVSIPWAGRVLVREFRL